MSNTFTAILVDALM